MSSRSQSTSDEWEDLGPAPVASLRLMSSGQLFAGEGPSTSACADDPNSAGRHSPIASPGPSPSAPQSSSSGRGRVPARAAARRPLCLCMNQTQTRIGVGHEDGFHVFAIVVEEGSRAHAAAWHPSHSTQERSESHEDGQREERGEEETSRARGGQRLQLRLQPDYNTSDTPARARGRRTRANPTRHPSPPGGSGVGLVDGPRQQAIGTVSRTQLSPAQPAAPGGGAIVGKEERVDSTASAHPRGQQTAESTGNPADEDELDLLLSYSHTTLSQCRAFDAMSVQATAAGHAPHEEAGGTGGLPLPPPPPPPQADVPSAPRAGPHGCASSPAALPIIGWDDDDDDDADERACKEPCETAGRTACRRRPSDAASGAVSACFLCGEEPIGFSGGGVGAMALQYGQAQMAVAGGGPRPMRTAHPRSSAAVGAAEVFLLDTGHCVQVLTVPSAVEKLFLDAQLLFVLTTSELRVYANPMEPNWTQCSVTVPLQQAPSLRRLSPFLSSPTTTAASTVYPPESVCRARAEPPQSQSSLSSPHAAAPKASVGAARRQGLPVMPCVLDYTRHYLLTRCAESPCGFSLLRYVAAHGLAGAAGALGSSCPTSVVMQRIAAVPEAHKNPISSLALHAGPAMDAADDAAHAPVSATVYVAAASVYATRITLWQLCAETNEPPYFALWREFRVGFRIPKASQLLSWAAASASGALARSSATVSNSPASPADASSASAIHSQALDAPSSIGSIPTTADEEEEDEDEDEGRPCDSLGALSNLQFLHGGRLLCCLRNGTSLKIFSTRKETAAEAKNVCASHPQAARNRRSALASLARVVPGAVSRRYLEPYTRQDWASCEGRVPLASAHFIPAWLAARAASRSLPPVAAAGTDASNVQRVSSQECTAPQQQQQQQRRHQPSDGNGGERNARPAGGWLPGAVKRMMGYSSAASPSSSSPSPSARSRIVSSVEAWPPEAATAAAQASQADTPHADGQRQRAAHRLLEPSGSQLAPCMTNSLLLWENTHAESRVDGTGRQATDCLALACATCDGALMPIYLELQSGRLVFGRVVPSALQ